MKTLVPVEMSRAAWGTVLTMAAVFALAGAWLLERFGLHAEALRPLSFVGAVVAVKLGLFTFWPWVSTRSRSLLALTFGPLALPGASPSLRLWNAGERGQGLRFDLALFAANVPTFVLNQEQRMIDWNPAFELVFGESSLRRGAPVTEWFALLDNFRRLPQRADRLYGEGILPLVDRERATFLSERFGRMVFTKIMAPVIDRGTGRILGWTVALNINSVNRRQEFFEQLFATIAADSRQRRYAASYDGLFSGYSGRRQLLDLHVAPLKAPGRVLDLASGTGSAALLLLARGHRVTAVERDTELLRRAKDRCDLVSPGQVRLVRQDPGALRHLPAGRYQAVVMVGALHRMADPQATLAAVYEGLAPGGSFTVSTRVEGGSVETLFEHLHAELAAAGALDALKHQFNLVFEHERELARGLHLPSRDAVRAWLLAAGFALDAEHAGLEDGHTLLIVARK